MKENLPKETGNLGGLLHLASILTQNTDSVLIGSLGLYLTCREALKKLPSDVDLYAKKSEDNIRNIIRILRRLEYKVYSWQDVIDENVDYSMLDGRYYIRGRKDDLVVDITYEIENLTYEDMKKYEVLKSAQEIKVYTREGNIKVLSESDRKEHMEQVLFLKNLM